MANDEEAVIQFHIGKICINHSRIFFTQICNTYTLKTSDHGNFQIQIIQGNCNYTFSPVDFANTKVKVLQRLLKLGIDAKVKYYCCS